MSALLSTVLVVCFYFAGHTESALSSGSGRNANNLTDRIVAEGPQCSKEAQCIPLQSNSCFDVNLPYKFTSITSKFTNEQQVRSYLSKFEVIRKIPRCWTVLQPLLCTLFLPRCDNNLTVQPTYEMCKIIHQDQGPCRLIESHFGNNIWPEYLKCDNQSMFPKNCANQYKDLKFSSAAKCPTPLVPTDESKIWFPGIDGCAFGCSNPHYSHDEYDKINLLIYHGALASLLASAFTVASFLVDWKSSNRYPAVIIFYLSLCLFFATFAWFFQFLFFTKEDLVCRHDKTSKNGDLDSQNNTPCLFNFVILYYFSIAALVWFVSLTYSWDITFKGRSLRKSHSKATYFHLAAWSIPFILTTIAVGFGEIDGSHLLGICFIGFRNQVLRIIFVFIPLAIFIFVGVMFLIRCLFTLIYLRKSQVKSSTNNKTKRIKPMLLRLSIFICFIILSVIVVICTNTYEFQNSKKWENSVQNFVVCSLNISELFLQDEPHVPCIHKTKPNISYIVGQVFIFFATGIIVSSWAWTSQTKEIWRRFFLKLLKANHEPLRAKKHEVIAATYENRFNGQDPVLNSLHGDPIGMNLTSACSQDISSTFANNFQHLVMRRGAITDQTDRRNHYMQPYHASSNHIHSSFSDVSQQRVSLDSFASRESRLSIQDLRDLQATVKNQRRKTRKEREVTLRTHKRGGAMRYALRRGSDTSTQSLAQPGGQENNNLCTQATSTGDLQNVQLPPQISPSFQQHLAMAMSGLSFPPPMSYMPPPQAPPIPPQHRVRKPQDSSMPLFSHGMSEQSNCLANPLTESRRPDSRIPYHQPNRMSIPPQTTPNGSIINPFMNVNMFNPMPMFPSAPFGYHQAMSPNMMPPNQLMPFAGAFNPFTMAQGQFNPMQLSGFPAYNPYTPNTNQCQNVDDLRALIRERDEHIQLIAPVDSGSDRDDILPIAISDSEGFFTDGGHRRSSLAANMAAVNQILKKS
ncbi:Protein smoothened [Halotydeus destructor]|nr:Protein smoothened [Halotydeus destructor]